LKVYQTKPFRKHYKIRVSHDDQKIVKSVIEKFLNQESLEPRFKDHRLSGDFNHCRECHLKNDLLLIYQVLDDELILVDIGTHSQLFE
jgi:mRNA interferase YafQ